VFLFVCYSTFDYFGSVDFVFAQRFFFLCDIHLHKPNPKIERTFRIRRKMRRLEKRHKAQETSPKMDAGVGG